ncbi:hypothetical protein [Mariprofundus ferrooxydans]|uniref:hypothetical protein n=1 Tax=Mariprofundus ferrooxydans TaxID=314344 RepID=UPI001364B061|nr:hypothetical protein [Mariprofundus ferrooxydans]
MAKGYVHTGLAQVINPFEYVLPGSGDARQGAEMRPMASLVVQNMSGLTLTSLSGELGCDLSVLSRAAGRLSYMDVSRRSIANEDGENCKKASCVNELSLTRL